MKNKILLLCLALFCIVGNAQVQEKEATQISAYTNIKFKILNESQTVYVKPDESIYHHENCPELGSRRTGMPLRYALMKKYKPCSICISEQSIFYELKTKEEESKKKEITVYITETGKKYHRGNCRYLRKSKIAISLKEACERGYKPCSVCKPPPCPKTSEST